ncbi:MAG: ATP-binding protein [Pirellulaceae bacterium]
MDMLEAIEACRGQDSLVRTFLSDDRFWPAEPQSIEQIGIPVSLLESLVCKHLAVIGIASGKAISEKLGMPFRIVEGMLSVLRTRQVVVHSGAAPFNDYYYTLTEDGYQRAIAYRQECAYVGPAPVTLKEYVVAMEAQGVRMEQPSDEDLFQAFGDISMNPELFDQLGPAINSGAGMFLFGAPGNGKSTVAKRIPRCFGQEIWIPRVLSEDDQIFSLFDACHHEAVEMSDSGILRGQDFDRRWVRIRRPTVCVGGELTMEDLELRFDPVSRVGEAPLQVKANGGCLLIDDFGRQRIEPAELLNRWIIPLEHGYDYLRLPSGKKIQIPFEQLIIFATNLAPQALVDEAFLRRIPFKIEIPDPNEDEFCQLFAYYAQQLGCEHRPKMVQYLLEKHYRPAGRKLRRCHPRDLLKHIRCHCRYQRVSFEVTPEIIDRAVRVYFAALPDDL